MDWVRQQVEFEQPAQEYTRLDYLHEVEHANDRVARLEEAIREAVKLVPAAMREVIQALQALRGIAQISAVTIVSELGQISRFGGARELMGYSGAVASEDSSGTGTGTGGDPLGSQGSLVLGRWHRLLFAVNAGSNDISVFAIEGLRLRLLDRAPSRGQMPVSIAVHDRLVYVVNAARTPNIQGFFVEPSSGHLIHLSGSQRTLPGGVSSSAAEVAFSPDGDVRPIRAVESAGPEYTAVTRGQSLAFIIRSVASCSCCLAFGLSVTAMVP